MSNAESVRELLTWLNRSEFARSPATAEGDTPLFIDGNAVHASYAGLRLDSLFVPIVKGSRVIAHEATLAIASPQFDAAHLLEAGCSDDAEETTYFDRLARTLHTLNFLAQNAEGDLHLNVGAKHILAVAANHGQVFEQIIRQCGLSPERIVLEIPEHAIRDQGRLRDAIAAWQSRRYRIAIDDFGKKHAQLARVLALRPDVLKVERNFWLRLQHDVAARQKWQTLLDSTYERGVAVIVTGVDSAALHNLIRTQSTQFAVQGDWYGAAQPLCRPPLPAPAAHPIPYGDRVLLPLAQRA